MKKRKNLRITKVRKNQKLIIIQAKDEATYENLIEQFNSSDYAEFRKSVGKRFILFKNNVTITVK